MPSYVRAGIRKCARIRALSEEGAKAAAYTVITMREPICPAPKPVKWINFIVDHPFLFELDSPDGLPLFIGAVTEL